MSTPASARRVSGNGYDLDDYLQFSNMIQTDNKGGSECKLLIQYAANRQQHFDYVPCIEHEFLMSYEHGRPAARRGKFGDRDGLECHTSL